jgi:hypothetical protein
MGWFKARSKRKEAESKSSGFIGRAMEFEESYDSFV